MTAWISAPSPIDANTRMISESNTMARGCANGATSRSRTTTLKPMAPQRFAATAPTGPSPTIAISVLEIGACISRLLFALARRSVAGAHHPQRVSEGKFARRQRLTETGSITGGYRLSAKLPGELGTGRPNEPDDNSCTRKQRAVLPEGEADILRREVEVDRQRDEAGVGGLGVQESRRHNGDEVAGPRSSDRRR